MDSAFTTTAIVVVVTAALVAVVAWLRHRIIEAIFKAAP